LPEVETTPTHRYEPVLSRADATRVVDYALERFFGPRPPEAVVFVREPLLTDALAVEFAARVGTALASRGIHVPVTVEVEALAPPHAPRVAKPFGPDDTADLDDELEVFLASADQATGIDSPVPRTKPRPEPGPAEGRPGRAAPANPAPVRRTRSIDRVRKPKAS
jgi:hypothetical protein